MAVYRISSSDEYPHVHRRLNTVALFIQPSPEQRLTMATTPELTQPDRPLQLSTKARLSETLQTITVKQVDHSPTARDYTITSGDSSNIGEELFTVSGLKSHKSFQRNFIDAATGEVLFELRRTPNSTKNAWFIETPDPERQTVLTADMLWSWAHVKVDVRLQNQSSTPEEVKLEVRGQDAKYVATDVLLEGQTIVKVKKVTGSTLPAIPFLNSNRAGRRDTWEVQVAAGVDLALVSTAWFIRYYSQGLNLLTILSGRCIRDYAFRLRDTAEEG